MLESLPQTLNLAVLDPKQKNSTYSYQAAEYFKRNLIKHALSLGEKLSVKIVSCATHTEVIETMKNLPNTIALQPIINTSTGLVPENVYEPLINIIHKLKFFGGFELLIENRLIYSAQKSDFINQKVLDLPDPKNYQSIEFVLSHKAPLGQCKEKIAAIQIANPKVKILDHFESTSEAVAALKSHTWKNAVAIGNSQTAESLALKYTNMAWQDYPDDNFTTFLVVGNTKNINPDLSKILNDFTQKFIQSSEKLNFIINLPILNQIGSLADFLSDLYQNFKVDLGYIKVECENNHDSNQIKPYFSGTIALQNLAFFKKYLEAQMAELVVFYPELDFGENAVKQINKFEIGRLEDFDFELKINRHTGKILAKIPNISGGLSYLLDIIKQKGINLTNLEVFARGCEPCAILKGVGDISNKSYTI